MEKAIMLQVQVPYGKEHDECVHAVYIVHSRLSIEPFTYLCLSSCRLIEIIELPDTSFSRHNPIFLIEDEVDNNNNLGETAATPQ